MGPYSRLHDRPELFFPREPEYNSLEDIWQRYTSISDIKPSWKGIGVDSELFLALVYNGGMGKLEDTLERFETSIVDQYWEGLTLPEAMSDDGGC